MRAYVMLAKPSMNRGIGERHRSSRSLTLFRRAQQRLQAVR